jgi:prepilin-type N-terminal cleavage/methylation domain-containing protein
MPTCYTENTGIIKTNQKKGFTFIELTITMSLFIILASVGLGAYFQYYSFSLINADVQHTENLIRETRFKALKNPTGSDYGIYINPATRTLTGFKDTYNPFDDENVEVKLEQLDITDLSLNPNIGTTNEILFERQTGKTQNSGSFTIGNNEFSQTFTINSQGVVD